MRNHIEFLTSIPCPEDGRWARPLSYMYQGYHRPEHTPFQGLYKQFAELCERTMRERGQIFVNRFSIPHILPYGCPKCGAMDYQLDEHGLHPVAACAFPKTNNRAPEPKVTLDIPSGELVFVERLEDLLPEAEIVPQYELTSPFYWARITEYAERFGVLAHAHHSPTARIFRDRQRSERLLIGDGKDTFEGYEGDFGATDDLPWVIAVDQARHDELRQRYTPEKTGSSHILLRKQLSPGRYTCTLRYPLWARKMVNLNNGNNVLTSVFMRHEGPVQTTVPLDDALRSTQEFAQANAWITSPELDRRFTPLFHAS